MKQLTGIFAAALALSLEVAGDCATSGDAGIYFDVPAIALSYEKTEMGPTTARIALYHDADGTTCIKLMTTAKYENARSIEIQRADTPQDLAFLFGSFNKLRIDHFRGALKANDELIFDLVDDSGNPRGSKLQYLGADGKPLSRYKVQLLPGIRSIANQTTVSVILDNDGAVTIPQYSDLSPGFESRLDYRFTIEDPESGTTMEMPVIGNGMENRDGLTTFSVPFVADFDHPSNDVDVYTAQVRDGDGLPQVGEKIHLSPYNLPTLPGVSMLKMRAGHSGNIRIAYPKPEAPVEDYGFYIRTDENSRGWGWDQPCRLKPGERLEVRQPKKVRIELFDAEGAPLNFEPLNTSRLRPGLPDDFNLNVGTVLTSSSKRFNNGLFLESAEKPSQLKPLEIPVDTPIIVKAKGLIFEPATVTSETSVLKLKPDPRPFEVTGKIVDTDGRPVEGAFVALTDTVSYSMRSAMNNSNMAEDWLESKGDFSKLGYYLTRSNTDGTFRISGNYMGRRSYLSIIKDGKLPGPSMMLFMSDSNMITMPMQLERLTGSLSLDPVTVNDVSTVTLTIDAEETTTSEWGGIFNEPRLFPQINHSSLVTNNDGTTSARQNGWGSQFTSASLHGEFSVPADTTFSLTVTGTRFKGHVTTDILAPLKPGEVRDLGKLKPVEIKRPDPSVVFQKN